MKVLRWLIWGHLFFWVTCVKPFLTSCFYQIVMCKLFDQIFNINLELPWLIWYILVWQRKKNIEKWCVFSGNTQILYGLLELVCSKNWSDTSGFYLRNWSFVLSLCLFCPFFSWYLDHMLTWKSLVTRLPCIRLFNSFI